MNRGILLGAVVLVTLALGGGGYYAYYQYQITCCAPAPIRAASPEAASPEAPAAPAVAQATPPATAPAASNVTYPAPAAPSVSAAPGASTSSSQDAPPSPSTATPAPSSTAEVSGASPPAPAAQPLPSTAPGTVSTAAAGAAAPAAAAPAAPAKAPVSPSFDIVRVDRSGDAVIAGRAQPGAEVSVLDGKDVIAEVTADPNGEWVLTLEKPLAPGNHELGLAAKSPDGTGEQKSTGVVVVAVPERKTQAAANGQEQPLAVLMPRVGQGSAKALQMPGAAAEGATSAGVGSRALVIEILQYDGGGHLTVSGHASAGGRVLLYLDNAPLAEVGADAKGDWTGKGGDPVAVGNHDLRGDLVAADGKVLRRVVLHFNRLEVPTTLAENQFLVVQPGNSLWRIARHVYGQGPMFTEIYRANRSEIVNPDVIYPGQVVTAPPG